MKKLLFIIGLIVVLAVAALVAIPMFVDPNDHKETIVNQVKKHTGRDLAISGDLKMSKFPALGVDIGAIELGNAPGFGDQPMLKSGQASVSVKLMPILKALPGFITDKEKATANIMNDVEISTLVLKDVYLNLARDKSGKSNFDDLMGEAKTEVKDEDASAVNLAALAIGGVDLENVNLVWDDQSQNKKYALSNLNLKTGTLQLNKPIDLEMSLDMDAAAEGIAGTVMLDGTVEYDLDGKKYSVKPIDFSANLKGTGVPGGAADIKLQASSAQADLNAGTASVAGLDLDALGTKISGDIDATNIFDKIPLANGNIKIDAQSIPDLLKALGQDPESIPLKKLNADAQFSSSKDSMTFEKLIADATLEGGLFTQAEDVKLDISGDVNITDQTLNLTKLSFAGLDAKVDGALKASNLQAKIPLIDGDLKITANDVAKLLIAAGQDPTQIPVTKINADVKLNSTADSMNIETLAATATVHGGQFKDPLDVKLNVKGDVNMANESANLTQLSFEGLGASVSGNIKANKILSPIPLLDGNLSIKAEDVPAILAALGQDASMPLKSLIADTKLTSTAESMKVENLNAKATLAGDQIPNSPVDVTLSTTADVNLAQETLNVQNFAISGMGLDVQGAVNGTQIIKNPDLNGNLKIAPFNLRQLMGQMNIEAPTTTDPKVLSNFGLNTNFAATKNSISLKGMAMKLDETNINGDLSVVNFSNPAPTFNINIDSINADRYMAPAAEGQKATAAPAATPETATAASTDLPMDTLRKLNAKGTLTIGNLIISNAKLKNVKLGLDAKGGVINLNPAQANLYQGSYNGNVNLDATGSQPAIKAVSALNGVQVAPMLTDLTGDSKIDGTLIGNINISAVGAGADAIKKTLNGTTDLKFTDGALLGVNVAKIIREGKAKLSGETLAAEEGPVKTDFSELSATTVIKNGLVSNQDFLMKSPFLRITGAGTANLVNEAVDYGVTAAVVGSGKGQGGEDLSELSGIDIPVRVSGTFSNLKYSPDFAGVLQAKVDQELDKQKEKAKAKVEGKLNSLLGIEAKDAVDGEASSDKVDLKEAALNKLLGKDKEAASSATAADSAPDAAAPAPKEEKKKPEEVVKDKLKNMLKF
ncbi:MAG: AsmA family protein [Gammaproteobacteria bacterium]